MKKVFYYLLTLTAVCSLMACSSDDDDPAGLELSKGQEQTVSIPANQTSGSITFTTGSDWTARTSITARSSELDWITLDKTSGSAGTINLGYTLQENTTGSSRDAFIVISSGGEELYVKVTQTATNGSSQNISDKLLANLQSLSSIYRIMQFDENLIAYDSNGLVTIITNMNDSEISGRFTYTFPYVYVSSTTGWNYAVTLNSEGFASHVEATRNGDVTTYDLQYSGNHLVKFVQKKGGLVYETSELKWSNGDVTQVITTWNGGSSTTNLTYGTTPNVTGLMLFDTQMWVDMDGMQILYYCGFFGAPTAHLIKSSESVERDGGDTYTFSSTSQYSFDSNGCPVQLVFTEKEDGQLYDSQKINFSWENK